MKINLLLPLALVLTLIPLSGAYAGHPSQSIEQMVPLPIKKCMSGIDLYRQLFVGRAAGLTLEESRIDNDFTLRVLKFIAETNSIEFDEDIPATLDTFTVEVYGLPDPQYLDTEWQSNWATAKFDECVAQIPMELLVPPELLEFMDPPELESDQFQLQRMIPENSI